MGGKASKKRSAGSTIRQSGDAPAEEPLASGDQRQPGQSTEPERVDSNTREDRTESSEAAISSEQAGPKEVVEASNAHEVTAVTTATEKKTPCEPHDGEEMIESSHHGLAFREIFVQYIPGKPHALTEFGALLYTHHGRHEFRAIDGTGLAQAVGLRHHDELLSINNPQSDISSASQLAVLECFSDIGTQIGLVIKRKQRKQEKTWLIAFHLNEKGNRPVVENIYIVNILDSLLTPVIPVDSAFDENPVYSYVSSAQVKLILEDGDRHMEIDTDKATYVLHKETVTLNYYDTIFGTVPGIPVAISTPESSVSDSDNGSDSDCDKDENPMSIEAVDVGPLSVVAFPSYMTVPGTEIPQNNMFFIKSFVKNEASVFKAANTGNGTELYISSDEENGIYVASLRASSSKFRIISDGNVLKTREDFLKLFKVCDS